MSFVSMWSVPHRVVLPWPINFSFLLWFTSFPFQLLSIIYSFILQYQDEYSTVIFLQFLIFSSTLLPSNCCCFILSYFILFVLSNQIYFSHKIATIDFFHFCLIVVIFIIALFAMNVFDLLGWYFLIVRWSVLTSK